MFGYLRDHSTDLDNPTSVAEITKLNIDGGD